MWAVRGQDGRLVKNHSGLNTGKVVEVDGIRLYGFYEESTAKMIATVIDGTTEMVFPSKWWEKDD